MDEALCRPPRSHAGKPGVETWFAAVRRTRSTKGFYGCCSVSGPNYYPNKIPSEKKDSLHGGSVKWAGEVNGPEKSPEISLFQQNKTEILHPDLPRIVFTSCLFGPGLHQKLFCAGFSTKEGKQVQNKP